MSDETPQLDYLDGHVRAAAFRLGKVVQPVQKWLLEQGSTFDLLTATPEQARHMADVETLLEVVAAYCEAADAVNTHLRATVETAEKARAAEATRAAFMARQFQLTHQDLLREKAMSTNWWETVQHMLSRQKGGEPV